MYDSEHCNMLTLPLLYKLKTRHKSVCAFDTSQISTRVSASKEICYIFFVRVHAW